MPRYQITIRQRGFPDFKKRYEGSFESVRSRFEGFCLSRFGDEISLDEIADNNARKRPIAWQAACPRSVRIGGPGAPKPFYYGEDVKTWPA